MPVKIFFEEIYLLVPIFESILSVILARCYKSIQRKEVLDQFSLYQLPLNTSSSSVGFDAFSGPSNSELTIVKKITPTLK